MGGRRRTVLAAAVVVVLAAAVGTCGGEPEDRPAPGSAEIPETLAYMPADAFSVTLVPTDLGDPQLRRLERLVAPSLDGRTFRQLLTDWANDAPGVDFARDVEPLLGGTAVLGVANVLTGDFVVALDTGDAQRLRALMPKLDYLNGRDHRGATVFEDTGVAVDGSTFLVGSGDETLTAAIDRKRDGTGADRGAAEVGLGEEATADALVRSFGSSVALMARPELSRAAADPWVRAVRGYGLTVTLEPDAVVARARLRTDPDRLSDGDLPLQAGDEAPSVGRAEAAINAGNVNQSRTTVFLARIARLAYPDSRFVRAVEATERELGIRFEDEVLAQFDGPSASLATPRGEFAAVSDLADPDRMRELLPRLAPHLPEILSGLQGLGDRGLLALLLFAPDAPLVPGALEALTAAVEVVPLPGGGGSDEDLLFRIDGLDEPGADGEPAFGGSGEVVFGMIGDRFVVGSSEARARQAAELEVEAVAGAAGAGVAWADLSTFPHEEGLLGISTAPLGEAVGELEASTSGLEGRLRIEVPGGLE